MVGQAGNRRGTCPSIQLRERKWQRDKTEARDFRGGTAYSLISARKRINVSSRPAPLLPPKPESTATSARPQANALENLNDPPGSSKYLSRPKRVEGVIFSGVAFVPASRWVRGGAVPATSQFIHATLSPR